MAIFLYMLVLLSSGFVLRLWEMYTASYFSQSNLLIVEDLAYSCLAYFGMIGIYGYAKRKPIFSKRLWQIYFIALLVFLPITPFVSIKHSQLVAENGVAIASATYAISTVLVLPAYWAWYRYAFKAQQVWSRHVAAA